MAEEIGKVLLIGTMSSGRSTLENWLVSGELKNRPSATMGTSSMCQTYVGRGWTVIDTMGFGEPLGSTVPDKFSTKMVIEFIDELKGRYSHIIFVMEAPERKTSQLCGIHFLKSLQVARKTLL
jgi:hypothetical protein